MADELSRSVAALTDGESMLGFETTEFDSEEYRKLIEKVENNDDKFPDVKVRDGKLFKSCGFDQVETEHNWRLWVPSGLTTL